MADSFQCMTKPITIKKKKWGYEDCETGIKAGGWLIE